MSTTQTSTWTPNNKTLALVSTGQYPSRTYSTSSSSSSASSSTSTSLPLSSSPHRHLRQKRLSKLPGTFCALCHRPKCHLRSHKSYLQNHHHSPGSSPQDFSSTEDLSSTHSNSKSKPKPIVNDLQIRTAFLNSYAYTEPSHLARLQPSSFRLDVFHNLPVAGGDRPDTHRLVWDFLNTHLPLMINTSTDPALNMNINEVKTAYLTAALSSPEICMSILATENQFRLQRNQSQSQNYSTSPTHTSPRSNKDPSTLAYHPTQTNPDISLDYWDWDWDKDTSEVHTSRVLTQWESRMSSAASASLSTRDREFLTLEDAKA